MGRPCLSLLIAKICKKWYGFGNFILRQRKSCRRRSWKICPLTDEKLGRKRLKFFGSLTGWTIWRFLCFSFPFSFFHSSYVYSRVLKINLKSAYKRVHYKRKNNWEKLRCFIFSLAFKAFEIFPFFFHLQKAIWKTLNEYDRQTNKTTGLWFGVLSTHYQHVISTFTKLKISTKRIIIIRRPWVYT